MCSNTSSRNIHDTVSNALAISILSSTLGVFVACSTLQESRTARKLSWMQRPLINALWFRLTSASSFGANRFAKHFVINLPKLWIKLIGR
jgi:hypothetical protein